MKHEQIFARIKKGESCWEWTGAHWTDGYGCFRLANKRLVPAHRIVYELEIGPIAPGLVLDHICGNKSCVNPAHLEPVTHGENMRRRTTYLRGWHARWT